MMRQAALDREHLYDFTVVYLSILYHDIVYSTDVTYHHFNEKQSTQIFSEDWVTLNISNDQFFAVQAFILATIARLCCRAPIACLCCRATIACLCCCAPIACYNLVFFSWLERLNSIKYHF